MLEFYPQNSVSEAVNKFNYTGNHYVSNICIKDTLKVQMNKHGQEVKMSYRKIYFTTKDELMCRNHLCYTVYLPVENILDFTVSLFLFAAKGKKHKKTAKPAYQIVLRT